MVKIHFQATDGSVTSLEGETGRSVMEVATANGVSAIEADCGGNCACGTCHVIVDEGWIDRLPAPAAMERDMLECVAAPAPTGA